MGAPHPSLWAVRTSILQHTKGNTLKTQQRVPCMVLGQMAGAQAAMTLEMSTFSQDEIPRQKKVRKRMCISSEKGVHVCVERGRAGSQVLAQHTPVGMNSQGKGGGGWRPSGTSMGPAHSHRDRNGGPGKLSSVRGRVPLGSWFSGPVSRLSLSPCPAGTHVVKL